MRFRPAPLVRGVLIRSHFAPPRRRIRWLGVEVWVAELDGKRHTGTLWWEDESSVQIREDGTVGLRMLPKASEGTRWGFAEEVPE